MTQLGTDLATGLTAGRRTTPTYTAGLLSWQDARYSTQAIAGGLVSSSVDLANGETMTSAGTNRPTMSAINSQPAWLFAAANSTYLRNTASGIGTALAGAGLGQYTAIVVGQAVAIGLENTLWSVGSNQTTSQVLSHKIDTSTNTDAVLRYNGASTPAAGTQAPGIVAPFVASLTYNGASYSSRVNKVASMAAVANVTALAGNSILSYYIGSLDWISAVIQPADARIARVLLYLGNIPAPQLSTLETWAAAQSGFVV